VIPVHTKDVELGLRAWCAWLQDASKASLSALGGPLSEQPPVLAAAAAHGVSTAQVLLRWACQKDFAVIPKSSSLEHMAENLRLDFELSDAEVDGIDALDRAEPGRQCWRNDPLRALDWA